MKILLAFLAFPLVVGAATLRLSNYSLYSVSAYEQVSFDPSDDTGRITLVDPLPPVSQSDYTVGPRALIRLRLRKAATGENYINTWLWVTGNCRIDVSQNGSADIVPQPPVFTATSAEIQTPATFTVPVIGIVTAPDWAVQSPEAGAFFCGLALGCAVMLFKSARRWFRRVGTDTNV
jgi:hypothetical protein